MKTPVPGDSFVSEMAMVSAEKRISCILRESVWSTDRIYDYCVPAALSDAVMPGMYVQVPFGKGNRACVALVLSVHEDTNSTYTLKSIDRIIDPLPVVNSDQLTLLNFIRYRYTCTYGDVLRLLIPGVVSKRTEKSRLVASVKDRESVIKALEEGQISSFSGLRILEVLLESDEVPVQELMQMLSVSRSPFQTLQKKGWIEVYKKTAEKEIEENEMPSDAPDIPQFLNDAQKKSVSEILQFESGKNEFLLYGITGSGKTEVYLQAAQSILEDNGSVLFLVPEISLTPQMIRWIKGRFQERVSVVHSRLTPGEKYEQWSRIRSGEARIVVGPRSAVFAPVKNLRLIILDEEQDSSYKSDTHPRYHARDIARRRASLCGAALVLGSATPAVETYYAAKEGYIKLLTLPERAASHAVLPEVSVVDMREELKKGNRSILSYSLRGAMEDALEKKEQILLFLNKRGYSGMLLCRACGEAILCDNCSVSMHMHKPKRMKNPILICHYCGEIKEYPQTCPFCESPLLGKMGIGTQQLEEYIKAEFPQAGVIRMDQDTTSSRGSHEKIISAFRRREADILIGTQMVAKGHDFPKVTVVGVLSTDILLREADFRCQERGFQLLTQAAGRAGRSTIPGRVFFQTYQPEDDVLLFAARQDYEGFFQNELEFRRRLFYPPFLAFGSIQISHKEENEASGQIHQVRKAAIQIIGQLPDKDQYQVYEPAPASLFRLRDKYRFRIFVKAQKKSQLALLFRSLQSYYYGKGYLLQMDIDPII